MFLRAAVLVQSGAGGLGHLLLLVYVAIIIIAIIICIQRLCPCKAISLSRYYFS